MSAIFFCGFECRACCCSTAEGFLAHAQVVFKMVWYGDVRFKQRAVTEFLVAGKESVTNIHKGLKRYRVGMLLIKALSCGALRIASFEKGQAEPWPANNSSHRGSALAC